MTSIPPFPPGFVYPRYVFFVVLSQTALRVSFVLFEWRTVDGQIEVKV